MTAWELLTTHSSLSTGTAWEHVNNQVGGSGGGVVSEGVLATLNNNTIVTTFDGTGIAVTVEPVVIRIETGDIGVVYE